MTHAWNQTLVINDKIAKQLIESQFSIDIDTIRLLDEGWDNMVYIINEQLIFRFPRREFGLSCIQNEIALLPYIANRVCFPLSAPEWIGLPSDLFPYPFAGYTKLPGLPVSDAAPALIDNSEFAISLASWLAQLHTLPVKEEHSSLIKGAQGWQYDVPHRMARCKENLNNYETYFLQSGFNKADLMEVIHLLPKLEFKRDKQSYVHADLYSRHILMDKKKSTPTGLIDWGDMHIGHPGLDLAIGMIFTKEVFQLFLKSYGADTETRNLLLFHAFCHHMSFLPYTCEQKNKAYLNPWASMVLARAIEELNEATSPASPG